MLGKEAEIRNVWIIKKYIHFKALTFDIKTKYTVLNNILKSDLDA